MTKLKVRQIGNSLGVVLPKDVLDRARISKDDELQLIETQNGIELRVVGADLDDAEAWIAKGADRYRKTLRALSK